MLVSGKKFSSQRPRRARVSEGGATQARQVSESQASRLGYGEMNTEYGTESYDRLRVRVCTRGHHPNVSNVFMSSVMKLSGLQREVLGLYRQCLRAARRKPEKSDRNFRDFARAEFKKAAGINTRDFGAIEHLLRRGRRQLELLSSPDIKAVGRAEERTERGREQP